KERESGIAGNPNSFGLRMVYGSIILLLYMGAKRYKAVFKWVLVIILLGIFLNGILDSGSRKSAIAFFILIVGFFGLYLANRKQTIQLKKIIVLFLITGFLAYSIFPIL